MITELDIIVYTLINGLSEEAFNYKAGLSRRIALVINAYVIKNRQIMSYRDVVAVADRYVAENL